MTKALLIACLLAGTAAAAGCEAKMNAAVTPGVPGASAAPTAAPTPATPAATPAGTATTAPASTSMSASTFYKLGRKWAYETNTDAAGMKLMTTFTREVTKVEGGKATVKQMTTSNGKTTESTETIDLDKTMDITTSFSSFSGTNATTESTWTQTSTGSESVTVKAGTFATTKYVGKLTSKGQSGSASATADQDATFWANDTIGLAKAEIKGTQTTSGYTINFTSVIELVSVTN